MPEFLDSGEKNYSAKTRKILQVLNKFSKHPGIYWFMHWGLFAVTWQFGPALRSRHNKNSTRSREIPEILNDLAYLFLSCGVTIGVYLLIFYILFFPSTKSVFDRLWAFYPLSVPRLITGLGEMFVCIAKTPMRHGFMFIVFYNVLNSVAEVEYLEGVFVHSKICGLIKSFKIGVFDEASCLKSQKEKELVLAQRNIKALVSLKQVERVTIITTSGYDYFGSGPSFPAAKGCEHGYLCPLLENKSIEFEIVLLNPNTTAFEGRADAYLADTSAQVIKDAQEYRKGFNSVLRNLIVAYKKNHNIHLRFTEIMPQWKMVFIEGEVWVQSIINGYRSDHSPMYGFKKTGYSMYHGFWHISEAIWQAATEIDLSKSVFSEIGIQLSLKNGTPLNLADNN
jgi:hypothetical protein